jgi:hypothetical protein
MKARKSLYWDFPDETILEKDTKAVRVTPLHLPVQDDISHQAEIPRIAIYVESTLDNLD